VSKYNPDFSDEALRKTLTGMCHQVSMEGLSPVQTFIHDKDTIIMTQNEDTIAFHGGMLVTIVKFLNSQTNPKTGDFMPIPESTNVN
jgi:hypothetical protein